MPSKHRIAIYPSAAMTAKIKRLADERGMSASALILSYLDGHPDFEDVPMQDNTWGRYSPSTDQDED